MKIEYEIISTEKITDQIRESFATALLPIHQSKLFWKGNRKKCRALVGG
jgi:hypothetical protein